MREECRMRGVNATLAIDTTTEGIGVVVYSFIIVD
jgi:hypothetical protein